MLRKLEDLKLVAGKRVVVRCSFDVPVNGDSVEDNESFRLAATTPFLEHLAQEKAKAVLIGHRGRPGGKVDLNLSLRPVFNYLSSRLGGKVNFAESIKVATDILRDSREGEFVLLENLRFDVGEEESEESFINHLSSLGDVYINNDFASAHRSHASVVGLAKKLPSYAGPLLANEVEVLDSVRKARKHPLVMILGGAKSETKLAIINNFIKNAETILLGGVLANTFLKAKGFSIGRSVVGDLEDISRDMLESKKIVLPKDVVVSSSLESPENVRVAPVDSVGAGEYIVDIGPQTTKEFGKFISLAAETLWNGPVGIFEIEDFAAGSKELLKALIDSNGRTIVGGGDVVAFVSGEGLIDKIDHVSTGGGAMLEFLAGERLPALEVLGYYAG